MKRLLDIYLCDILWIIVCTLLIALPASYEPHHFAIALLLGSVCQSLAYIILLFFIIRKYTALKNLVFSALFLLFCIESFTYLLFGSRLNPAILTLILQTSQQEIKEFFQTFILTFKGLFYLLLFIVIYWLIFKLLQSKKSIFYVGTYGILLSILYIIFGISLFWLPLPFPLGHNSFNQIFISYQFIEKNHSEVHQMDALLDKIRILYSPKQDKASIIVFVIGESFNKHHSNLYGYRLPTSPLLTQEKNNEQLIVFNDVHTPTNGTAFAMKYFFTLKSCDNDYDGKYVLLPAVFKKAGYKVGYFDNQYTRSSSGSLDYSCVYFLNPQRINNYCFDLRNNETTTYDGDFISKYKKLFFKQNKSLNIIHLMGQHFNASQRYPQEYSKFSGEDIHRSDLSKSECQQIAEYDNATYYNDKVLGSIIDEFRQKDAVIIYVSDHGEQIYDDDSHYFGRVFGSIYDVVTLKNVYQVPFMIWCSNQFIEKHPEKYNAIRLSSDKQMCIDNVSYLLLDLADINFNYYCPKRSIINNQYVLHKTIIN